ncbi:MAG: putative prophage repressor [Ignavibacteria bacterium]|nr:putative prophage repressor [Ignavibacteria bacterium]
MKKDEYKEYTNCLSDHGLYILAKRFIIQENLGFGHNHWKHKCIFEEAERRNIAIYDYAKTDSLITIECIMNKMYGATIIDLKRVDLMSEHEIKELVHSLGAAANHPFSNQDGVGTTDLAGFFGIKSENLYFGTVSGLSMKNADLNNGDRITVDTSAKPDNGDIIVALVDGDVFIKRYKLLNGDIYLESENEDYEPYRITSQTNFSIFGVVRHLIRALKN